MQPLAIDKGLKQARMSQRNIPVQWIWQIPEKEGLDNNGTREVLGDRWEKQKSNSTQKLPKQKMSVVDDPQEKFVGNQ